LGHADGQVAANVAAEAGRFDRDLIASDGQLRNGIIPFLVGASRGPDAGLLVGNRHRGGGNGRLGGIEDATGDGGAVGLRDGARGCQGRDKQVSTHGSPSKRPGVAELQVQSEKLKISAGPLYCRVERAFSRQCPLSSGHVFRPDKTRPLDSRRCRLKGRSTFPA